MVNFYNAEIFFERLTVANIWKSLEGGSISGKDGGWNVGSASPKH